MSFDTWENAIDPHSQLTCGGMTALAATESRGFPIPPWLGSNSMSAWISVSLDTAGLSEGLGTCNYRYETIFDLTGFKRCAADVPGA